MFEAAVLRFLLKSSKVLKALVAGKQVLKGPWVND